jgi:hypothetical protein
LDLFFSLIRFNPPFFTKDITSPVAMTVVVVICLTSSYFQAVMEMSRIDPGQTGRKTFQWINSMHLGHDFHGQDT